jgi:hypothetical protein
MPRLTLFIRGHRRPSDEITAAAGEPLDPGDASSHATVVSLLRGNNVSKKCQFERVVIACRQHAS